MDTPWTVALLTIFAQGIALGWVLRSNRRLREERDANLPPF